MGMSNATTRTAAERNTLANAYQLIADRGAQGTTRAQLMEAGVGAAYWACEQLVRDGLIVVLANEQGRHCVENRYATRRAARGLKVACAA